MSPAKTFIRCIVHGAQTLPSRALGQRDVRLSTDRIVFDMRTILIRKGGTAGFLAAVEEAGLPVGAVMGTSSGALAGALYSAGYAPLEVRHSSATLQSLSLAHQLKASLCPTT